MASSLDSSRRGRPRWPRFLHDSCGERLWTSRSRPRAARQADRAADPRPIPIGPEFGRTVRRRAEVEGKIAKLAIHEIFPHGSMLPGRKPVWLPDFGLGVRCFGFFGRAPLADRGDSVADSGYLYSPWGPQPTSPTTSDNVVRILWNEFPSVRYGNEPHFSDLECHLCDTLDTVHKNAEAFWEKIKGKIKWTKPTGTPKVIAGAQPDKPDGDDCDWLVIDAVVRGFQGHRFLRRDNLEVPSVARHRLLAASATRQGLGKRVVSALFPVDLWKPMKDPVKHFVLQAAEQVGGLACTPLYPNLPPREDMDELVEAVRRDGEILGYEEERGEVEYTFDESDVDRHSPALKKLNLDSAIRRRLNLIPPTGTNESPSTSSSQYSPDPEQERTSRF